MPYIIIICSAAILFALAGFFWKRYGVGSGRAFGNKIAKHNGLSRSTFWYLIDNGTKGSSQDLLISLERSNMGVDQASIEIGPTLQRGIERLEARFGPQEMYDLAKPIVARLVARSEQTPDLQATGQSEASIETPTH